MAYDYMQTLGAGGSVANQGLKNASEASARFQDILTSTFSLPTKAIMLIENSMAQKANELGNILKMKETERYHDIMNNYYKDNIDVQKDRLKVTKDYYKDSINVQRDRLKAIKDQNNINRAQTLANLSSNYLTKAQQLQKQLTSDYINYKYQYGLPNLTLEEFVAKNPKAQEMFNMINRFNSMSTQYSNLASSLLGSGNSMNNQVKNQPVEPIHLKPTHSEPTHLEPTQEQAQANKIPSLSTNNNNEVSNPSLIGPGKIEKTNNGVVTPPTTISNEELKRMYANIHIALYNPAYWGSSTAIKNIVNNNVIPLIKHVDNPTQILKDVYNNSAFRPVLLESLTSYVNTCNGKNCLSKISDFIDSIVGSYKRDPNVKDLVNTIFNKVKTSSDDKTGLRTYIAISSKGVPYPIDVLGNTSAKEFAKQLFIEKKLDKKLLNSYINNPNNRNIFYNDILVPLVLNDEKGEHLGTLFGNIKDKLGYSTLNNIKNELNKMSKDKNHFNDAQREAFKNAIEKINTYNENESVITINSIKPDLDAIEDTIINSSKPYESVKDDIYKVKNTLINNIERNTNDTAFRALFKDVLGTDKDNLYKIASNIYAEKDNLLSRGFKYLVENLTDKDKKDIPIIETRLLKRLSKLEQCATSSDVDKRKNCYNQLMALKVNFGNKGFLEGTFKSSTQMTASKDVVNLMTKLDQFFTKNGGNSYVGSSIFNSQKELEEYRNARNLLVSKGFLKNKRRKWIGGRVYNSYEFASSKELDKLIKDKEVRDNLKTLYKYYNRLIYNYRKQILSEDTSGMYFDNITINTDDGKSKSFDINDLLSIPANEFFINSAE